jgi:hypothetical protein
MTLAILTVDRSPEYIFKTLGSLFMADPLVHELGSLHLMVDAKDATYLDDLKQHTILKIHPLDPEVHDRVEGWGLHRRFNHNCVRCLSLPVVAGGGLIVIEDDVVFRDRFLERLIATIAEIEEVAHIRDYALALTTAYDLEREHSFFRGAHYCSYGYPFYGTQAMYYPKAVARNLADYLFKKGVETYTNPGDLLVGEAYGDRMYACARPLATHIGRVSTGLGGCGPSPGFDRPHVAFTRDLWGRIDGESG